MSSFMLNALVAGAPGQCALVVSERARADRALSRARRVRWTGAWR